MGAEQCWSGLRTLLAAAVCVWGGDTDASVEWMLNAFGSFLSICMRACVVCVRVRMCVVCVPSFEPC